MIFAYEFETEINYFNLANLAFELGQYEKAIRYYKKALVEAELYDFGEDVEDINEEIEFDEYEIDFEEKMTACEDEYYDEIEYHKEIRDMSVLPEEIYQKLIDLYVEMEDYDNAINYCNLMLKSDVGREINTGSTYIELANLYKKAGNIQKAVKIIDEILVYENEQVEDEIYRDYFKELYLKLCLDAYEILSDIDIDKAVEYLNTAESFYDRYKKYILDSNDVFAKLFEKIADIQLQKNNFKSAVKNYISASELYKNNYDNKIRYEIIKKAREIYVLNKIDDEKLFFYLEYNYTNAFLEVNEFECENSELLKGYIDLLNLYRSSSFTDKYLENMILKDILYIDGKDSLKYGECDYIYLAKYNIKRSIAPKLSAMEEYKEAAESYEKIEKYDKAIQCYEKSIEYFNEAKNSDEEYDFEIELNYCSSLKYSFYTSIYDNMANIYEKQKNYRACIECIMKIIDLLNTKRDIEEISSWKYKDYIDEYFKLAYYFRYLGEFEKSVNCRALIVAIYNSDNLTKKLDSKYEDIEKIFELFKENKILDFILEEGFILKSEEQDIAYALEYLLNDLKEINADENTIKMIKKKIKLVSNIYFEI